MTSPSAPTRPAFGPYSGPRAYSVTVCPVCLDWQLEFPHEAGIHPVVFAVQSAHFAECPLVPRRAVDSPGTRRNAAAIRLLAWLNRNLSR